MSKQNVNNTNKIASFRLRIDAALIDFSVFLLGVNILLFCAGNLPAPASLILTNLSWICPLYFALFTFYFGCSPGKSLLGLRITTTNSNSITISTIVNRFGIDFLLILLNILFVIHVVESQDSSFSLNQAVVNYSRTNPLLAVFFSFLSFIWIFLNIVAAFFSKKRLTIRDRLAKTIVITERSISRREKVSYMLLFVLAIAAYKLSTSGLHAHNTTNFFWGLGLLLLHSIFIPILAIPRILYGMRTSVLWLVISLDCITIALLLLNYSSASNRDSLRLTSASSSSQVNGVSSTDEVNTIALSSQTLFENYSNAIVTILVRDKSNNVIGQGSGVSISKTGLIVTNLHVVLASEGESLDVKYPFKPIFRNVSIVAIGDTDIDLALLKVGGRDLPFAPYSKEFSLKIGQPITTISSPEGFTNSLSEGSISGLRRITKSLNYVQFNAPISSGSSGGAVFERTGKIACIITSTFTAGQNLNFCIPIQYIGSITRLPNGLTLREFVEAIEESIREDNDENPPSTDKMRADFEKIDGIMFAVYQHLISKLNDSEKVTVRNSQRKWLLTRDKDCSVNLMKSRETSVYNSTKLRCIILKDLDRVEALKKAIMSLRKK